MATTRVGTGSVDFLRGFLKNPRGVGSVWPSSQKLASGMLRGLPLRPGDAVVEYGPGTGAFTGAIRDRIAQTADQSRYLGIEREGKFCRVLRERYRDLAFAEGDVRDVRSHLDARGLGAPRAILSGLPLILMPAEVMTEIVRTAAEILIPGGEFRTFSYVHSWPASPTRRLRALMREHFEGFEMSSPVWWNCPPAFVLRGKKCV